MSNEAFSTLLDAVAMFILIAVIAALLIEHTDSESDTVLPSDCRLGCELRSTSEVVTRGDTQCIYFGGALDSTRLRKSGDFTEKCTIYNDGGEVSYKIHF